MKAVVLANFHLIGLTCFALLLFFGMFSAACLWIFRKSSTSLYSHLERLPLQND
jgi:cbb3-type cytochrome oxidase subunit 3